MAGGLVCADRVAPGGDGGASLAIVLCLPYYNDRVDVCIAGSGDPVAGHGCHRLPDPADGAGQPGRTIASRINVWPINNKIISKCSSLSTGCPIRLEIYLSGAIIKKLLARLFEVVTDSDY